MILTRCKCGRYTTNGLLCVFCSQNFIIDPDSDPPKEEPEDEIDDYDLIYPNEEDRKD